MSGQVQSVTPVVPSTPDCREAAPETTRSQKERNPDHHIWCNNGTYFVHLTLLRGQGRYRLRKSLKTKDVAEARKRRDRMVTFIREQTELTLLLR
jgi:hypothetical protein